MTRDEFQKEMDRLAATFGPAKYSSERASVIWKHVKDLDATWWRKTVDYFIGHLQFAPLMPEIGEQVAIERERNWRWQKQQNRKDAADFTARFNAKDVGDICATILKKMNGHLKDTEFKSALQSVANASPPTEVKECWHCGGSGLIFRDDRIAVTIYRCPCPAGNRKPAQWPVISRRELESQK